MSDRVAEETRSMQRGLAKGKLVKELDLWSRVRFREPTGNADALRNPQKPKTVMTFVL